MSSDCFARDCAADDFRVLVAGDVGETGLYEESEPLLDGVEDAVRSLVASTYAEGGRLRAGARETSLSLPRMSVDEAGVGGRLPGGIVGDVTKWELCGGRLGWCCSQALSSVSQVGRREGSSRCRMRLRAARSDARCYDRSEKDEREM